MWGIWRLGRLSPEILRFLRISVAAVGLGQLETEKNLDV
jgi:hypothetical protein